MEPCLFRHGKGDDLRDPAGRPVDASMEPCLFRHGKGDLRHGTAPRSSQLQWSHVFSDMVREWGI